MQKIACSVVMSTYNRAHLLTRSLVCYEKQEFPKHLFELVIVDDGSTDNTAELVKKWSEDTGIQVTYLVPHPKGTDWRDCAATLNYGIRVSMGRNIILTHPEIMVGRTSVLDCVNKLEEFEKRRIKQGPAELRTPIGLYACCRTYYLSPRDQTLIDTCPWQKEGTTAMRLIEGFYEQDTNGHPDFSHRATDIVAQPGSRLPVWESLIFGGFSRETWLRLGGLQVTQKWGSIDVLLMHRRAVLGIGNYTCPSETSIVVHQNHDLPGNVITPRIEQVWKDELRKIDLSNPNNLIYPVVDEIGWN
jgi:hypothetical protein